MTHEEELNVAAVTLYNYFRQPEAIQDIIKKIVDTIINEKLSGDELNMSLNTLDDALYGG